METLSVDTNAPLNRAKKIMLRSIFVYFGFYLLSFIPTNVAIFDALWSLGLFISWIIGCYGLYCFSNISNSTSFKYYVLSVLVVALYALILGIVLGMFYVKLSNDEALPWVSLCVFVIILSLCAIALNVFWSYKVSYEMSNITGLKHFITAFRIFCISLVGLTLLGLVFGWLMIDFLSIYIDDDLSLESLYFYLEQFIQGRVATFTMLTVLFLVMGILTAVYNVFIVVGIWNIKEVRVREKNA